MKGQAMTALIGVAFVLLVLVGAGLPTINSFVIQFTQGIRVENQTATPTDALLKNFTIPLNNVQQGINVVYSVVNGTTQFGQVSAINCTNYLNIDDTSNRGNWTFDAERDAIVVCGYTGVGPVSVSYSYKPYGFAQDGTQMIIWPLFILFLLLAGFAIIVKFFV